MPPDRRQASRRRRARAPAVSFSPDHPSAHPSPWRHPIAPPSTLIYCANKVILWMLHSQSIKDLVPGGMAELRKCLAYRDAPRLCVSEVGQGVRRYMSMTAVEGSSRTTTSAAPTRPPGTSPRIVRPSDRQVNLGMTGVRSGPRDVPKRIEDRLIVALDVPNIAQAR